MFINGYDHNPFPFEVDDVLMDEDGDLCQMEYANSFHISVHYLTGELADGHVYTYEIDSARSELHKASEAEKGQS
jgi:hypothetical protein